MNSFSWTPSEIKNLSSTSRKYICSIICLGQLLTICSIIAFFAVQICFIIYVAIKHDSYCFTSNIVTISVILCILNVIVGIWLFYSHIYSNPRLLRRLKKNIEYRLAEKSKDLVEI